MSSTESPTSRLLFENDRLRMTSLSVQPGATADVLHSVPTARWRVLDDSQPSPKPVFCQAGDELHLDNTSGQEALCELVFEILQAPRKTDAEVAAWEQTKQWQAEPATERSLDNEYCRLWDFRMPPHGGSRLGFHQHMLTYAFVFLRRGKLHVYVPDGDGGAKYTNDLEMEQFGVHWNDVFDGGYEADGVTPKAPKAVHAVENGLDTEFREYMIELK
eukprot:TRINITY_DN356_c1_g1_i2.p2 TRINITY_DN356_c1_g1~~TRINITY_DN356_c1_g1_i2.p2  ORF type:complete len:217 (+),score=41.48 TRINITY_DN356_c1_g1_i2:116-766(+)